jgi:hypothetical protein
MTGTRWTAPGEGSTLAELNRAFEIEEWWYTHRVAHAILEPTTERGNLCLTGAPITAEDWARLESDDFKVGE